MKRLRCVGVTNDPIFGAATVGSIMWVRMTGFVVALMTRQCTRGVTQTSSCMIEKWGERLINFINNFLCLHFLQICLNWLLTPVWCSCFVKISDNFIYCHFRFVSVSDVIYCFHHLSIHSVNFKYVTTTNIKRCNDLLCWCLVKQTIKILGKINTCFENKTINNNQLQIWMSTQNWVKMYKFHLFYVTFVPIK